MSQAEPAKYYNINWNEGWEEEEVRSFLLFNYQKYGWLCCCWHDRPGTWPRTATVQQLLLPSYAMCLQSSNFEFSNVLLILRTQYELIRRTLLVQYVELFHNQNKFLRIKRQNKRLYSDESIFRYTPAVLFILRIYSDTKKTKKCAPIIISQNKAFLILFFLKCY